jgi:TonB family protein
VLLWLTCAIIFGVYISIKYIKFCNIIKKEPLLKRKKVLALLEECKARMKSYTPLKITVTDKVKSPALFGYIRPRLLLPAGVLKKLDDTELSYIFLHELGHLKRHDIGVSWVITFLQIFQWFNPFVWLAFYQMRIDQESACDASVLSRIKQDENIDYAGTIIGFLENFYQNRRLPALVGILENQAQIKNRITTIVNYRKNSKPMMFFPAVLLIIIGVVFFSFTGFSKESNEQPGLDIPFEIQKDTGARNNEFKYIFDASMFAESNQEDSVLDQFTSVEDEKGLKDLNRLNQKGSVAVRDENISGEVTREKIKPKAKKAFASIEGKEIKDEIDKGRLNQETQETLLHAKDNNINNHLDAAGLTKTTNETPVKELNAFNEKYNAYRENEDIIRYLAMADYYREQAAEAAPLAEKIVKKTNETDLEKSDEPVSAFDKSENPDNTKGTGNLPENERIGEKIYSPKGVDKYPKVVRMYPPRYPHNAVLKGIEGRVLLRFILDKEGNILDPQVVRAEPEGIFEQAALDTLKKYRIRPAMKDGKFVNTAINLPISFDIDEI